MSKNFSFEVNRLKESQIELLRTWRNQQFVVEQMEYSTFISSKQQQQWYEKIHNSSEHEYYIFSANDEAVGMVHLSKINFKDGNAEVGLFIGNPAFIGTGIALYASLFILKQAFYKLNLKLLVAKVKKTNTVAIQYNSILGFQFDEHLNENFNRYFLTKEIFDEKKLILEKLI
jgi:RimJ/RimL family protein N-acetyltransferase